MLEPTIANVNKLTTWKPRSKPRVFIGKSRQHAANVSLVHDPRTNFILPQFHIMQDDDFQNITNNGFNSLPGNWREVFDVQHYADDESFTSPLQEKLNNNTVSFRRRSNGGNIPSSPATPSAPVTEHRSMPISEGDSCAMSTSEGDPMSSQTSTSDLVSETTHHVSESESDGFIAQSTTRSGHVSLWPKWFM